MKIFMVRHGQTTGDVEGRYGGDYDDELSEDGAKESKQVALELRGKGIEIIFHSPRKRAKHTAKIISEKINVPLVEIVDFRERNSYGIMTGMKKKEAKLKYPKEVKKLDGGKYNHNVKGSEQYESFKARVLKAFERATSSGKSIIAIVTHDKVINCINREILMNKEFKKVGDCAILEIEKKGNEYKTISLTRVELNA